MKEVSNRLGDRGRSGLRRIIPVMVLLSACLLLTQYLPMAEGSSDNDESEHDYHNNEWTFLIISFVMTYGAAAIVAGLFTMKYGQRRSKLIASFMLLSGLAIWGTWIYFKFIESASYPDDTFFGIIYWSTAPIIKPLLAVIGVLLGGGLALFIFLTVVVRS